MTAPARISQADMQRATRVAAEAGVPVRVVFDLVARRIEFIMGDMPVQPLPVADKSVWSDDDV